MFLIANNKLLIKFHIEINQLGTHILIQYFFSTDF